MGIAKILVLVGGVLGIASFFMPYFTAHDSRTDSDISISPYVAFSGVDSIQDVAEGAAVDAAAELGADKAASVQSNMAEVNEMLDSIKTFLLIPIAPAIFLILFGALGMKGRFGRGLGAGSLIFGILGLGIWALLNAALGEAEDINAGLGLTILMASGALGLLGGLMGLIKPEPKTA